MCPFKTHENYSPANLVLFDKKVNILQKQTPGRYFHQHKFNFLFLILAYCGYENTGDNFDVCMGRIRSGNIVLKYKIIQLGYWYVSKQFFICIIYFIPNSKIWIFYHNNNSKRKASYRNESITSMKWINYYYPV